MSNRDEVAEVLAKALRGWFGGVWGPESALVIRLADALLASDWLARREAEARAAGVEEVRRRCEPLADEWEARQNGRVRGFGARLRAALAEEAT